MHVRAYLRASTEDQDALRAKEQLEQFAEEQGLKIAATYVERQSGASLKRPELFRLLGDCHKGDILLVEQVDRLSRLNGEDWETLKTEIKSRGVRVVALDLPTSYMALKTDDEITDRLMESLNGMMLDMLAALARKDYADRRRRQAQGIKKAKAEGKFKGRPVDEERHRNIKTMIEKGHSWSEVSRITGASRATIARALKRA
ncbi:DNA invertase Pin-like site-specific DNA recombinase [Tamilnaduibacter salinus]|uniref:DNA invertase Pin-like site-specific DNA recombinase n=1 Tax=Tamilnaduibacter salinus TaxID=1484056 RepID=A0A2U1D1D3_9GAMM|nr:recombinase family protein [Tamilnaduibacter salinus]PVY79192.1 DNA invertase Pin-like site-specific DNA recombinase [Tamilnaduibacter salinus]